MHKPLVVDHRDLVRILRCSNFGAFAALRPEVDDRRPEDEQAVKRTRKMQTLSLAIWRNGDAVNRKYNSNDLCKFLL